MYEILKERYQRNFVRKDQLLRYVELGKITQEQYQNIIEQKEKKED
ncbi:XkdX family protein [Lachnospiraceae bacterium 46-61]